MSATQLFNIDPRNLPATRSTDKLLVRFNADRTAFESIERNHEVSVYDVLNTTTREGAYEVEFTVVNGRKLGGCTCRSRVVCKHITRAVALHIYRKQCERTAAARETEQRGSELWRATVAR